MINRRIQKQLEVALARQSAVAVIGPRQVGKTTVALEIANNRDSIYLDLESGPDRDKLSDPVLYLSQHVDNLVVLDEIHRMPALFQELRGLIDSGRRHNKGKGRFLILGSAAIELLRQSGETLAGRIEYVDMGPLDILEITANEEGDMNQLWLRGGFPDAYLATSDTDSFRLRRNFIRTYLERDVAMFGPRIPTETLERLWIMLAHSQGTLLNASNLARNLGVSTTTVNNYLGLLVDLLLIRRLQPFHANLGKRLVRSPKIYVRDSGLVHALLGIEDMETLLGHPIVGNSWEGFVIEQILAVLPEHVRPYFYRTAAGAEIDLLLDWGGKQGLWAIEIKRSLSPKVEKGFRLACQDLKPTRQCLVYPGADRYPKDNNLEVVSVKDLAEDIFKLT
ncbi:MAG: ATP-binding protein [Cyanobacteria bacterium HKST-UBA03]|nr:ATP-binding protein [Cyanobacteria bacterium HKST-UBA03]